MTPDRTQPFRRNDLLEELLHDLNDDLQASEAHLVDTYRGRAMHHPVLLVMGPLRSGTTLLMQWLANTGLVAYPTNLLSRFYRAPILGAKIQLLLTDPRFNFRDELGEFVQQSEYSSENGKTKGVLAPNEFWYFWRRFLADPSRDVWTDRELQDTVDFDTIKAELNGVMDVFQKPFVAKGMLFNYNIPLLDRVFPEIIFLQVKRDPLANVISVLKARTRQLGSESAWYSFKIPEYDQLREREPIHQVAGQVYYIDRAVTTGLEHVAEERKIVVSYERFCTDPESVFHDLVAKLGVGPATYRGPEHFQVSEAHRNADRSSIDAALEELRGKHAGNLGGRNHQE